MWNKKHDYIPRSAVDFDVFMCNIIDYVKSKVCAGPPSCAEWDTIPQDRFNSLETKYKYFKSAFNNAFEVPTPANNLKKNEALSAATHELREFVNQFLRFPPVTDTDRVDMGIPNRDTVRSVHVVVNETVDYALHIRGIREVVIDFWVLGHTNKAKPQGYNGAVVKWGIYSAPPKSIDDLVFHSMATKTPFPLYFDETERGKIVYIALAWQNKRGMIGGWSEIKSTIIP